MKKVNTSVIANPSEPTNEALSPEELQSIGSGLGVTPTVDTSAISAPESDAIPLTAEELAEVGNEAKLEKEYGNQALKAGVAAAARGASFGISDQILTSKKFGKMITGKDEPLVDSQALRELEERNRVASVLGEAGAIGAQALATGGTSLAAKVGAGAVGAAAKAGQLGEKLTEKALSSLIKKTGSEKLAAQIIQKGIAKTAGSAVEGGFYGAGQLVSEDALGTSEFNAENLLSSVGTGALLGGAVGGALGSLEAIVPVVSKTGKVEIKKGTQNLDREKAALEFAGYTPSEILKLGKNAPDVKRDFPDFLVEAADLGYLTSDKKLYQTMNEIREKAGSDIHNILGEVENISKSNPQILSEGKSFYTKVVRKLDETIREYKGTPGYSDILKPVKKLRNEYNALAESSKGKLLSPLELDSLRRKVDDLIYEKRKSAPKMELEANKAVRDVLRQEIDSIADRASAVTDLADQASLFTQLKKANKNYRISTTTLPKVERKIDKSNLLSTMDTLRGGALIGAFDSVGAGIAAAMKLAESDFVRKFKVIQGIEKSNNTVTSKVSNAVSQFLKPVKNVAKPTSINVLLNTTYGRKDLKGKKPESRLEAFENTANNLTKITTDPDYFNERLNINTLRLAKHAPETAAAIQNKVVTVANFLQSKMPKDARQTGALDLKRIKWKPSSTQLAKFERYVEAAEHPLNILEDLKTGTVSPEQVETLKAVYPDLYKRIQTSVMEQVSTAENIPYSKRLQLGLLLDIPADSSLTPETVKALQATFKPVEPEKEPAPTRLQSLKVNNSLQTPVEKTMTRK